MDPTEALQGVPVRTAVHVAEWGGSLWNQSHEQQEWGGSLWNQSPQQQERGGILWKQIPQQQECAAVGMNILLHILLGPVLSHVAPDTAFGGSLGGMVLRNAGMRKDAVAMQAYRETARRTARQTGKQVRPCQHETTECSHNA